MRSILLALAALAANGPALAADPGLDAYGNNCAACHSLDAASSPVAPSLKGVAGRKIASLTDFDYSTALKAKTGTWTDANLQAFIADPQTFAPGSDMPAGEPDPVKRQAIIDYLKTVK
jgi:cytochrome c